MENILLYWILQSFCLLTFVFYGRVISKSKSESNYWITVIPVIIVYSLIEGLRWNRGVDYSHYCQDLTGSLYTEYSELLYLGWITVFKWTGLPYWCAFILYSALLIISFLQLIKNFRRSAYFSLPLFYLITTLAAENLIRQYLAVPFIMLCMDQVWRKKWIIAIVFALCAVNIHYSAIIPLLVIVAYEICNVDKIQSLVGGMKILKKPYMLIVIFLFTFFFWKDSYMNEISKYIYMFDVSSEVHGAGYLSDRWLTTEGISDYSGHRQISIIGRTLMFLVFLPSIYYGFYAIKENYKLGLCFCFSYLAIIFDNIRGNFEIYGRVEQWFLYMIPVLYAVVYDQLKSENIKKAYGIVLILQFFIYDFVRNIGSMPYAGCAFVWDN